MAYEINPLALIHRQITWNRLIAVVEEQARIMIRTAFSTTVREAGDLSAGVFDLAGRMMAQADLLFGYHTQPHLDQFETGQRAARGLGWMIENQRRPVKRSRKLPMITAAWSAAVGTPLASRMSPTSARERRCGDSFPACPEMMPPR